MTVHDPRADEEDFDVPATSPGGRGNEEEVDHGADVELGSIGEGNAVDPSEMTCSISVDGGCEDNSKTCRVVCWVDRQLVTVNLSMNSNIAVLEERIHDAMGAPRNTFTLYEARKREASTAWLKVSSEDRRALNRGDALVLGQFCVPERLLDLSMTVEQAFAGALFDGSEIHVIAKRSNDSQPLLLATSHRSGRDTTDTPLFEQPVPRRTLLEEVLKPLISVLAIAYIVWVGITQDGAKIASTGILVFGVLLSTALWYMPTLNNPQFMGPFAIIATTVFGVALTDQESTTTT